MHTCQDSSAHIKKIHWPAFLRELFTEMAQSWEKKVWDSMHFRPAAAAGSCSERDLFEPADSLGHKAPILIYGKKHEEGDNPYSRGRDDSNVTAHYFCKWSTWRHCFENGPFDLGRKRAQGGRTPAR